MMRFTNRAAVLATAALLALQASAALSDSQKPDSNTVAMESLTIVHEGIDLAPVQQDAAEASKRKAAPKAPSSSDPEWKYVPVRRF